MSAPSRKCRAHASAAATGAALISVPPRSSTSVAFLALIVGAAAAHIAWMSFLCDDAFIAFRYAANLAAGDGLVFNAGERVEGYTNLAWVLICAAGARVGVPPERLAGPLGAMIALGCLAFVLERRRRAGRGFIPAGILLAANTGWAAWSTGGLETSLFTALVTLAFLALLEESEGRRPAGRGLVANGLLLGAAVLTRPEGALFATTTTAYLVMELAAGRLCVRRLAAWAALWLTPLIALEAWRLLYYGSLFPNTFAAKAHGVAMIGPGLRYLALAFTRLHLIIPAIVIGGAIVRAPHQALRSPKARLAAITVVPYLVHVAVAGGDFMDLYRFVVPVLPIGLLLAGEALGAAARTGRSGRVLVVALLVPYGALHFATARDSQLPWTRHGLDSIGLLRQYVDDWSALGRHLADLTSPDDVIATAAAGCVPYYAGRTTIDQHGLTMPDLSGFRPEAAHRPGHALVLDGATLLAARPEWILGSPQVRRGDEVPRTALMIGEEARDALEQEYRLLDLRLPGGGARRCVVAVRRDLDRAGRTP